MQFSTKTTAPANTPTACLVLGVFSHGALPEQTAEVDKAGNKAISKLLNAGDMSGKIHDAVLLHNIAGIKAQRVLLLGCGKKSELDLKKYTEILHSAAVQLKRYGIVDAVLGISDLVVEKHSMERKAIQIAKVFTTSEYRNALQTQTGRQVKTAGYCGYSQGTRPGQKGPGNRRSHSDGYERSAQPGQSARQYMHTQLSD